MVGTCLMRWLSRRRSGRNRQVSRQGGVCFYTNWMGGYFTVVARAVSVPGYHWLASSVCVAGEGVEVSMTQEGGASTQRSDTDLSGLPK